MADNITWRHDEYRDDVDYSDKDWRRGEETDWKRRKTNDERYDNISNRAYLEQGYQDDQYHDDDRRSAGYPGKRLRVTPSEASEHIIFLGLDPDFTESDLDVYLTSCGYNIASATIIRDRHSGMSKSFGFAQFLTVEDAKSFLQPNFPFITLPAPSYTPAGTPASTGGMDDPRARRVKIDYSQSAAPHNDASRSGRQGPRNGPNVNDGTRDIGSAHVSVILLRGLDPGTTPDAVGDALRESEGHARKSAKGMMRVIMIVDKASKVSLGLAFVEFVDVQSASAVLANTMSPTLFPSGFRITGRPIAASFAHPNSFHAQPDNAIRDDSCIDASSALGGRDFGFAKYWDEQTVASEAVFEFEVEEKPAASKKVKEKKKERVKDSKDRLLPGMSRPPAATRLKTTAPPISLSFNTKKPGDVLGKHVAATGISENKLVPAIALGDDDDEPDDAAANTAVTSEDKSSTYRRVAPMIASKRVANDINKWNHVQEESRTSIPMPPDPLRLTSAAPAPEPRPVPAKKRSPPPVASTDDFIYADQKKMTCLLCSRQFKSLEQLRRHNAESDLHKKNLADSALQETALAKASATRASQEAATDAAPKYRDRALERRAIYGQPDTPMPEPIGADSTTPVGSAKRKYAEGPAAAPKAPAPPPPPINPGEDTNNKGNKLLQKMGWAAGTGLGISGEGRVAPVTAAVYAQGVGLGASKGKEIGQNTGTNPFDYASNAKDSARERYQNS